LLKKPWCVASLTDLSFSTGDRRSCPAAHRHSPHRSPSATTPSVMRLSEPQLPCPCPADYPIPTGGLGEDLATPQPPARRRESHHRVSSGRGDRPECTPSVPLRHGLAGPQWSWQLGPMPIQPSELSRPSTREPHRPWAECEAQYCVTVRIFFQFILIPRNCFKIQKFVETCSNVQNLQNKFCMNPLEPLFIVGLTKLTFTQ
jgi:hypothetical protein